ASAGNQPRRRFTPLVPFGILLLTALLSLAVPLFDLTEIEKVAAAFGIPIFLVYLMRNNPFRFGLSVGAIMLGGMFLNMSGENILHRERNFFGVLKVAENRDGDLRIFYHGNTVHGKQHLDPERRCVPLAYFHPAGPLGDIFEAYHSRSLSGRVSGIGLGVGAINAYSRPGEEWTFYEIDPAVADIAEDERWFTYLSACAATPPKIVLGDARLRIEETLDETYGLIVLDAFSSDAIPVHLITEEAVDLYFSKLAPGGMMAFHISNRNLDLRPVLAGAAKRLNLKGVFREDREQDEQIGKFPSTWAVLARTADDLGPLADNPGWIDVESIADPVFWSDDFSNILSVLKWFR
ncbi:MAG TPA: fused MFS/spermidine synthase, partial [Acidobacteriota bacterium]|nr:fused MFS/spermidine synthase [Acidobacteriota bacterium]